MVLRRSSRATLHKNALYQTASVEKKVDCKLSGVNKEIADFDDDDYEDNVKPSFTLDGVVYDTYQELVNAKRERNQKLLQDSGLLTAFSNFKNISRLKSDSMSNEIGIKKRQSTTKLEPSALRKSRRLAGVKSDGISVEKEKGGKFSFSVSETSETVKDIDSIENSKYQFFRDRLNNGMSLTIQEAISACDPKWIEDSSLKNAEALVRSLAEKANDSKKQFDQIPTSNVREALMNRSSSLIDTQTEVVSKYISHEVQPAVVAKVCPERIYGIACHPSTERLIVSAGDKVGYVGLWNVDSHKSQNSNSCENSELTNDNDVSLFRYHSASVSTLNWTSNGSALLSTSYDGTVRWFDVEKQSVEEIFATYDDDEQYRHKVGFGLDEGHRYWIQFGCLDHRSIDDKCLFLSTSFGTVMHLDLRVSTRQNRNITFHEELSDKKINTVSLHPNGFSLMTSGLDNTVRVWDIRNFGDSRSTVTNIRKHVQPISMFNCGRSINSSYFSPSGKFSVSTHMGNKLEIFENLHLQNNGNSCSVSPVKRISHDNQTGRWLSTFMATFHPQLDIFCIGSMQRPRAIEIFDTSGALLRSISGEGLTSVASRCCFHPSADRFILAGGNSSGRVTIVR